MTWLPQSEQSKRKMQQAIRMEAIHLKNDMSPLFPSVTQTDPSVMQEGMEQGTDTRRRGPLQAYCHIPLAGYFVVTGRSPISSA